MNPHDTRRRLAWECLLIFGALPPSLALLKPHGLIYWLLWLAAFQACRVLQGRYGYRWREEWNARALTLAEVKRIVWRFIPCAIAVFIFAWVMIPERLFSLITQRPLVWVMVMIWYPVLSVLPQEVLFRSFFFRRYAPLFADPRALMAASALAFGWVHIVLMNQVAVLFAAAGGLIFADTYRRTRSLAAAAFEHALYGCWIFTLGMGFYFYHGLAVR